MSTVSRLALAGLLLGAAATARAHEGDNTCTGMVDAARQGRHSSDHSADGVFWPPNHQFRTVIISAENDTGYPCDVTITDVRQDEPLVGAGDGHTSPDVAGCSNAGNESRIDVRAERSGTGNGRYYHVMFSMKDPDSTGPAKLDKAVILVPHDQDAANAGKWVDDGPQYRSYAGGRFNCSSLAASISGSKRPPGPPYF